MSWSSDCRLFLNVRPWPLSFSVGLLTISLGRGDRVLQRLLFDDEPCEPLTGQEFPPPPEHRSEPVAVQNQELNMDDRPHQLGEHSCRADAERLHDGEI